MNIWKRYRIFIISMLAFAAIFLTTAYQFLKPAERLPVFSPADVNPEMVDSTVQHIGRAHKIADWSFTNQNGQKISQRDFEGKIYVADFFFCTCTTICPIMTKNFGKVQEAFRDNPDVLLLSHTVMPDIDSVPVLRKYATEKGAIDGKWHLVTGKKEDIYYLARKSYLAVKTANTSELYDMVHTENLILVDRERRIRGFYDGTKDADVDRLISDIQFLLTQK